MPFDKELIKDLGTRQYWDVRFIRDRDHYGHIGYVTTRQEYSTELCHEIIDHILQNQKLRELVVDAADFYDGKKTQIIGQALQKILDKIGIKDVPKCYSKEYVDKIIKHLKESKNAI